MPMFADAHISSLGYLWCCCEDERVDMDLLYTLFGQNWLFLVMKTLFWRTIQADKLLNTFKTSINHFGLYQLRMLR